MAHIVVIGTTSAGVIGLQTAVTLLENGYNISILAKHFPGDESNEYTSPWAGAIWRTHATGDQKEQCQWDLESYRSWMDIAEKEPARAAKMGIQKRPMHIYSLEPSIDTSTPSFWFSSLVQNFAILSSDALPPGCRSGCSHDTITLNPPKYLQFLYSRAIKLGARTVRTEFHANKFAKEIEQESKLSSMPAEKPGANIDTNFKTIVVNCTGIGAKSFCQDDNVYPIRGQTVLVRVDPPPPSSDVIVIMHPATAPAVGGVTYIVPRPGTDKFIFGGTKKDDDWNCEADVDITNGIIERCKEAWPLLKNAKIEILSTQVGLRPGRKGGARVEREEVGTGEGRVVDVIHQYGHAGAGYQNSIGSANKVLGLIKEIYAANNLKESVTLA